MLVEFVQDLGQLGTKRIGEAGGGAFPTSLAGAWLTRDGAWSQLSVRIEEPIQGAPFVFYLQTCSNGFSQFDPFIYPNPYLEFPDPVLGTPAHGDASDKGGECSIRLFSISGLGSPPTGAIRLTFDEDTTRSHVIRLADHVLAGAPSVVVRGDSIDWDAAPGGYLFANVTLTDTLNALPFAVVRTGSPDWLTMTGGRHGLGRPRNATELSRVRYYLYLLDPSTWD